MGYITSSSPKLSWRRLGGGPGEGLGNRLSEEVSPSPASLAAELGMTAVAIRQAKARVLRRVKEEVGDLLD